MQARFGCGFPGGNAALKAMRILPTADIGAEDFFLRLIFFAMAIDNAEAS